MLRDSNSVPRLELPRESGWYAILRVLHSRRQADDDFTVALLERCSVLVHPGHFFNFSQEGFLVVSPITPEQHFQEGLRRLEKFFEC